MAIKPKSFFHPVLSKFSSDYLPDAVFSVEFIAEIVDNVSRDQVSLGYEVFLNNNSLRDFIIDKRAAIALDIYCGDTMFRELRTVIELEGTLLLPAGLIKGHLDIQPLIVVTDASNSFTFEEISPEYQETTFFLEEGLPLAIAPSVTIPIDFAFSSFKEIVKILHSPILCQKNTYRIDLVNDQIVVHMGTNAHSAWTMISSDAAQKPVLFFSVYKDCITAVLEALTQGNSDTEYRWSEHFTDQIEKRNIKLPAKDASFSEINDVALQILGNRGFEKMVKNDN